MKIHKVTNAMRIFFLFAMIGVILYKNITFLSCKYLDYSHRVVYAVIEDIQPVYDNVVNLQVHVKYFLEDSGYDDIAYYSIGDEVGDRIELIIQPGKPHVSRNMFVFSWVDLCCLLIYFLIFKVIRKRYEEKHRKVVTRYVKKQYHQHLKMQRGYPSDKNRKK